MATTTTRLNGESSNGYSFYADVIIDDTIQSNNTFSVRIKTYLKNGNKRTNTGGWTKYLRINDVDERQAFNQTINTSTVPFYTGETLIQDETFSVPITMVTIGVYSYIQKSSYTSNDPGTSRISGYVSMPKVQSTWSVSLLSLQDIEDANGFSLPITKYVSTYYDVVDITDASGSTIIRTINDAYDGENITFTSSELNTIFTMDDNSSRSILRFYMNLRTYSDSTKTTQIGTQAKTLLCEAYLNNADPSASFTEEETNANILSVWGGQPNKIIKYASELLFKVTASGVKGATISSVKVNGTPVPCDSDEEKYIATVTNPTTNEYYIEVTDSRNKATILPFTSQPLVNYVLPSIHSNWTIERATQVSSDLVLNATIDAFNDTLDTGITNAVVVQYSLDNSTWTTIQSSSYTYANNQITISNLTLSNLISYQNYGTFYLKAYDLLNTSQDNKPVAKGVETFSYGENDLQVNGDLFVADEDGNNPINILKSYSTSEKMIGYWIDGKPLYRKVLSSNNQTGSNVQISHGISNFKILTHFEANCSNITIYGTGFPQNNGSFDLKVNKIDSTYIYMNISSAYDYNFTIYYILEYTKTSD